MEKTEEGTGSSVCYGSDMFGEKEFGVEYNAKVTDVGAPWDDSLMEVDWEKGSKSASGEQDCLSFVDVDSYFPFGKITEKDRSGLGESVNNGVSPPGLSEDCGVVGI